MRRALLLVVLAACGGGGNSSDGPIITIHDGGTGDGPPPTDAPPQLTYSYPTPTTWDDQQNSLDQVGIDPTGALTVGRYELGTVIAHASTTQLWQSTNINQASWDQTMTVTPKGAVYLDAPVFETTGSTAAPILGLADTSSGFSMWFEFEVLIDAAGDTTFTVDTDGVAFMQVQTPPDSQTGVVHPFGLLGTASQGMHSATITAPGPGWYGVRIGYTHAFADAHLEFLINGTGLAPDHLRARVEGLSGLTRTDYPDRLLSGDPLKVARGIALGDFGAITLVPTLPGARGWSTRFAGEVYIATAGDYTLFVAGDGSRRVRLDDQVVTDGFSPGGVPSAQTLVSATLSVGWHPLVVDIDADAAPNATIFAHWATAPSGVVTGVPIPASTLRPTEPVDDAIITYAPFGGPLDCPTGVDTIGATLPSIDGPGTATSADLLLTVQDDGLESLGSVIFIAASPTGVEAVFPGAGTGEPVGGDLLHWVSTTDPLSTPLAGAWSLSNTISAQDCHAIFDGIALTLHATIPPLGCATMATWMSPTFTMYGHLLSIVGVTYHADVPTGAAVSFELRACDDSSCDDANALWSAPIASGGALPSLPMGHYLQARIQLTSNGTDAPIVHDLSFTVMRQDDGG
ncbi:MAG TPA: hypothetical protein VGM88_28490 [Kofleriaceae bacterium]|jgi:hypothetical protein